MGLLYSRRRREGGCAGTEGTAAAGGVQAAAPAGSGAANSGWVCGAKQAGKQALGGERCRHEK